MKDIAVVSQNEKGLWHAALFRDAEGSQCPRRSGVEPDAICTAHTREDVETMARAAWPDAELRDADEEDDT